MSRTIKIAAGVLVAIVSLTVLALLISVKPYRAPSASMLPAIDVGDRFLVSRLDRGGEVGDIVVFAAPEEALENRCPEEVSSQQMCATPSRTRGSETFVKRVVAVGGDRIALEAGRIIRNGRPERGYDVRGCETSDCELPQEITVPAGHVYLLGDNRGESSDSRVWGPVPEDWIIGRRILTYWPPGG